MLRINLLPASLGEQKKLRMAIIGSVILFVAILAAMLIWFFMTKQNEADWLEKSNDMARQRTEAEAIQTQAQQELAKVQPILDKVQFVEQVRFHNTIRQKIFAKAAQYTDSRVEYDSMAVTGDTFSVNAYCRSIADLGRFYLTMFNNPDFTAVSIQGIPGWPNAASVNSQIGQNPFGAGDSQQQRLTTWFPVQLTAKLVRPVVTPSLPGSLTGQSQAGGFGGPGGGFNTSSFSGPPAGGGGTTGGAPTDDVSPPSLDR